MGSEGEKGKPCPQPIHLEKVGSFEIIEVPCKTWGCETCGPKRREELRTRVRVASHYLFHVHGPHAQFLTLTLDPKRNRASRADGTKEQARYVSACWRKLISKWRERCRRRGTRPPWKFKTVEWRERTAAMHLHVILVGWVPSGDHLQRDIVTAGFGHVYDIQKVESLEKLTTYVTKYITKLAKTKAPRYVNRYSYSRGGLPSMELWKRLRMAGFADALDEAADGNSGPLGDAKTPWWTGEARSKIEDILTRIETAALGDAEKPEWRIASTRPHADQITSITPP